MTKELNKLILSEEIWKNIKRRVVLPLWNCKFKKMYEDIKMDYDDFESLAGIELTKALKTYDSCKSNIYTYATRVISKKALTELRNCMRDKRKTLCVSDSIDRSCDEDSSKTLADNIPSNDEKAEHSELSELRVSGFINSLNNNQLRVLILTLLDFDNSDMPVMLNISSKTANEIIRSLKDADLTRILYRRSF